MKIETQWERAFNYVISTDKMSSSDSEDFMTLSELKETSQTVIENLFIAWKIQK